MQTKRNQKDTIMQSYCKKKYLYQYSVGMKMIKRISRKDGMGKWHGIAWKNGFVKICTE